MAGDFWLGVVLGVCGSFLVSFLISLWLTRLLAGRPTRLVPAPVAPAVDPGLLERIRELEQERSEYQAAHEIYRGRISELEQRLTPLTSASRETAMWLLSYDQDSPLALSMPSFYELLHSYGTKLAEALGAEPTFESVTAVEERLRPTL